MCNQSISRELRLEPIANPDRHCLDNDPRTRDEPAHFIHESQ